jgi:DNA-binding response OmpR family regulator
MFSILLVDDDEQLRAVLGESLRREGYDVREACDGRQGERMYRERRADLVITDLIMPEKEGLETILDLRQNHPGVKIIAMSGGGRSGFQTGLKVAEAFGARRVLAKPFSRREMLEAVRQVLEG